MGDSSEPESEVLNEKKASDCDCEEKEEKEGTGPNSLQVESFYKSRGVKTITLLICVILIGIACSAIGPSFVDLELYLSCDTRTLSVVTPLGSSGVFLASLVILLGLSKSLSTEYSIGGAMICMAVVTILWTAVRSVYWFLALALLHGFSSCMVILQVQPYCLQLWTNHRFQKPVIHSVHALISLGLAIGPFIITPFLAEHNPFPDMLQVVGSRNIEETLGYSTKADDTRSENISEKYENKTQEPRTYSTNIEEYTGRIYYAFVTIGLPLLMPAIIFVAVCLKSGVPIKRVKNETDKGVQRNIEQQKLKPISRLDRNLLIGLTLIFYTFNSVTEFVPQTYFTLYVTTVLSWKSPQRTLINSAFYGSLCIGRVLGIPLSSCLKQRTILASNVCIILIGSILLLLSTLHDAIMWMAASLIGLGLSTVFGALFLWLSESIEINNRIMGAITISSSVGSMFGPFLTGQLFATVSPMCFTYVVLSAAILDMFMYVALRVLERRRLRKYKKTQSEMASE